MWKTLIWSLGFIYSNLILITSNKSIWSIYGTLTGTTTPGLNRPGSNRNEKVFLISRSSKSGDSPPYAAYHHIRDTLLLDWFLILGWITQSALLSTHSWKNRRLHVFLKSINAKQNANSTIQDLNSSCQFHFLWW